MPALRSSRLTTSRFLASNSLTILFISSIKKLCSAVFGTAQLFCCPYTPSPVRIRRGRRPRRPATLPIYAVPGSPPTQSIYYLLFIIYYLSRRNLTLPPPSPASPPTQTIYYFLFLISYFFSIFPKHFAKFHCISQSFRVQLDTTLSGYITSNYNKEVL